MKYIVFFFHFLPGSSFETKPWCEKSSKKSVIAQGLYFLNIFSIKFYYFFYVIKIHIMLDSDLDLDLHSESIYIWSREIPYLSPGPKFYDW